MHHASYFSHYLSFRAASAPPSPVKRWCVCHHMVTATQRTVGGCELRASTVFHYLSILLTPLPLPYSHAGQLATSSGVTFLAQKRGNECLSLWY